MRSFRPHLVSLVSVPLALAVGVVLGGGPLQGDTGATPVDRVAGDRRADPGSTSQRDDIRRAVSFEDHFAAGVAPALLRARLRGHEVTIVALPGADEREVTALVRLVQVAGGRVGGTFTAGGRLVDVTEKELVDQLGSQLQVRVHGVPVPADAGPDERIGALIGRAVGTDRRGGAPVDSAASTVLGGLRAADLLSPRTGTVRRGDLVVFVAGSGDGGSDSAEAAATIITSVVHSVDGVTSGTVLADQEDGTGARGPVGALRRNGEAARDVSTVDTLDGTAGQVVTVLALAGQAAGRTGHYGGTDAPDGALPGARATPGR
jgi:hypothetical protein